MRETWFVLEDGTNADPLEVAPDDKGVLRHKSGVAVAIGPHGNPKSRSVDLEEQKKVKVPERVAERVAKPPRDRQVKAEDESGAKYRTR